MLTIVVQSHDLVVIFCVYHPDVFCRFVSCLAFIKHSSSHWSACFRSANDLFAMQLCFVVRTRRLPHDMVKIEMSLSQHCYSFVIAF